MPTYEYRCKDCGDELEAVQGFHDDPLTECPACGGPLRKKFGSVGISFKGSGFYKNDSRSSSGTKTSSTERVELHRLAARRATRPPADRVLGRQDVDATRPPTDSSTSASSSDSGSNGLGLEGSGSKDKTPAAT